MRDHKTLLDRECSQLLPFEAIPHPAGPKCPANTPYGVTPCAMHKQPNNQDPWQYIQNPNSPFSLKGCEGAG